MALTGLHVTIYVPGTNSQRLPSFLVQIVSPSSFLVKFLNHGVGGQYHAVEIGARPPGDMRCDRRKGGPGALQDSVHLLFWYKFVTSILLPGTNLESIYFRGTNLESIDFPSTHLER